MEYGRAPRGHFPRECQQLQFVSAILRVECDLSALLMIGTGRRTMKTRPARLRIIAASHRASSPAIVPSKARTATPMLDKARQHSVNPKVERAIWDRHQPKTPVITNGRRSLSECARSGVDAIRKDRVIRLREDESCSAALHRLARGPETGFWEVTNGSFVTSSGPSGSNLFHPSRGPLAGKITFPSATTATYRPS
jgi:hypothetical protein